MDPTISFILQVALAVLMLFFGIILNGMRLSIDQVRLDLKSLNDAVLGKYATKEDVDKWRERHIKEAADKWATYFIESQRRLEEQRKLDHEVRDHIQLINITLAKMQNKPYGQP